MHLVLELNKVCKSFGNKMIYRDLSFSFGKGCYAIKGLNGTGKTALLEMLAGVSKQDKGSISLAGIGDNISMRYKKELTFIPSAPSFFPSVTGDDFLSFIYSIKKGDKLYISYERMIEGFNLLNHLKDKFINMSLGTQKKLFLTTLAVNNGKLIVMDEPSNALDIESVQFLAKIILEMTQSSIVILATHDDYFLQLIKPLIIRLKTNPITELNIEVDEC